MCSPWGRTVDKCPAGAVDRDAHIVRNPDMDRRFGEKVDNRCETARGCSGLQVLAREGSRRVAHIFTAPTTTTGILI
jgi:hypothetical protein